MFARFSRWYLNMLETRPILTKSVSSSILVGLGDVLTQTLEHDHHKHPSSSSNTTTSTTSFTLDYVRTLKMASFGIVLIGPTLHLWYKFLDRFVAKKYPVGYILSKTERTLNAARQMFVDQTIFAPFALFQFLAYMGTIEGKSFDSILEKMKQDMWPTLIVNWYIWPAVQMLNFTLVPLQYRVLFVNSVSILWNAYLSHVQHKA
ncbi:hypothetical protein C9374_003126 [Naegleria lovaniensis]|uniref:Uncharacterized protein n=1 Tax=Naegleria lovaniensis TaxID=51637 RepID=A0AA88KQ24_NAELO|nr:uncharacterized protein C9374_003126 [Naegleria lovaniensis]KAG2385977.1 hypothetical protein C9374_003126 [Naegleria lovaniensis]